MAEAAGLAVGALSLAGLFNNAVQCFEFVQLGRNFGRDFETSQLKLECARLRLYRWGAALGLGEELQDERLLEDRLGLSATEMAKNLLGQALAVFEEAKGISRKYVNQSITLMTPRSSTSLGLLARRRNPPVGTANFPSH